MESNTQFNQEEWARESYITNALYWQAPQGVPRLARPCIPGHRPEDVSGMITARLAGRKQPARRERQAAGGQSKRSAMASNALPAHRKRFMALK
jgi:hypothetical protein